MTGTWPCEAYGSDGLHVGALCLFSKDHERKCQSPHICYIQVTEARWRLWDRLHVLARLGDELAVQLLQGVDAPEQLLKGSERGG